MLLPSPTWAEGTVLSLCVCDCVSVCLSVYVLPQNHYGVMGDVTKSNMSKD